MWDLFFFYGFFPNAYFILYNPIFLYLWKGMDFSFPMVRYKNWIGIMSKDWRKSFCSKTPVKTSMSGSKSPFYHCLKPTKRWHRLICRVSYIFHLCASGSQVAQQGSTLPSVNPSLTSSRPENHVILSFYLPRPTYVRKTTISPKIKFEKFLQ